MRIREELARPGSTTRTPVRYIWRPHHVPQASNIVCCCCCHPSVHWLQSTPRHRPPLPFIALCAHSKLEEEVDFSLARQIQRTSPRDSHRRTCSRSLLEQMPVLWVSIPRQASQIPERNRIFGSTRKQLRVHVAVEYDGWSKCSRLVRRRCKACPHHNRKRMTHVSTVQLQSSLAAVTRHTELTAVRVRRRHAVKWSCHLSTSLCCTG